MNLHHVRRRLDYSDRTRDILALVFLGMAVVGAALLEIAHHYYEVVPYESLPAQPSR